MPPALLVLFIRGLICFVAYLIGVWLISSRLSIQAMGTLLILPLEGNN